MIPCAWKYFLGIECPGCGFQRSVLALLHGDLYGSLKLFPATIPLLALFIFTALHIRFKFTHGARTVLVLFISSAAIIVASYIFKISAHGWMA